MALQGLASGMSAWDPLLMDMAAGMVGHTAQNGADRLQSYASEELENHGGVLGGKERLLQLAIYCACIDAPIMHTWQDFLDQVGGPGGGLARHGAPFPSGSSERRVNARVNAVVDAGLWPTGWLSGSGQRCRQHTPTASRTASMGQRAG
jgi:hypothetical protein